jgi:hypothetical protein
VGKAGKDDTACEGWQRAAWQRVGSRSRGGYQWAWMRALIG